jgi:hypothetical protein
LGEAIDISFRVVGRKVEAMLGTAFGISRSNLIREGAVRIANYKSAGSVYATTIATAAREGKLSLTLVTNPGKIGRLGILSTKKSTLQTA